jgi:diacylglycerol kinase family enzyme/membrane-associated phospholipid phosphatase
MRRSADLPLTSADAVLKRLTKTANHSVLWFAIAAVLASRRGPTRRAALRGAAAIAGASASANLVGKTLFPRRRPAAELVPVSRRLTRRPTSSSFPSGHAASAAAFTTAVAMESPKAAAAIAPLAAAVAYSRVHTGVHWPSDVGAGALLGVGIGLATRRWWPLGREEPASAHDHADLSALADGEGLAVLVNPGSGLGNGHPGEQIQRTWPKARVVEPDPERDLIEQLHEIAEGAELRALGVAGGDGTVAAVASVAVERGLPMVLIPAGTLNHFARDVGVDGLEDTAQAVSAGDGVVIDLSTVEIDDGDRLLFVNTASLGGYPDMVRLREELQDRWGKWPAAGIALAKVLTVAEPLHMEINGEPHRVWMLFVGNGPYRPKGFAPTMRPRLDSGLMDVRYISADVRFSRIRFFAAAVLGSLHRSRTYQHLETPRLDVRVFGESVAIATDGEVGPEGSHFAFEARPAALGIYRT